MEATLPAEFGPAAGGETVVRRGLLFRAGSYPDKNFDLTPEEMADAAREFEPVLAEMEHLPTILDGKLGRLREVSTDGAGALFGALEIPRWLHETVGPDPLKVSLVWDRETKRIKRVGLVRSPRITDAAVFAAFSAATGEEIEEIEPAEDEEAVLAFFSDLTAAFDAAPKGAPGKGGSKSGAAAGGVHWVTIDGHPVPITDKGIGPEHLAQAASRFEIGHHGHEALREAHAAGKIETDAHLYGIIRAARGHEEKGAAEADAYAKAIGTHGVEPAVRVTGQGSIKARGMAPLPHQATADLVRLFEASRQGKDEFRAVRQEIGEDRAREAAAHAQRLNTAGLLEKAVQAHKGWQEREERREQARVRRDTERDESRRGLGGRGLVQELGSLGYDVHLRDHSTGKVHTYRTLPPDLPERQYEAIYRELNTSGRQNTTGGKEKLYPVPDGGRLQMFTLHDLIVSEKKLPPGAFRPGGGRSRSAGFSLTAARSGTKGDLMSAPKWLGKLLAAVGVDPEGEDVKAIEAEFAAETPAAAPPPVDAEAREQVKRLQQQLETERRARLESDAATFAKGEVAARRALPAEEGGLAQLYVMAALDDAANPREVAFSAGAETKTGTRVDALRASLASRPAHQLATEMLKPDSLPEGTMVLFNKQETEKAGDEKPPDEKRKAELLDKSPLGRAVAANGKGA